MNGLVSRLPRPLCCRAICQIAQRRRRGSGNRERQPSVSQQHHSRLPDPYNRPGQLTRTIHRGAPVGARQRRNQPEIMNGLVSRLPRPLSGEEGQATGRGGRPFPSHGRPGCLTPTIDLCNQSGQLTGTCRGRGVVCDSCRGRATGEAAHGRLIRGGAAAKGQLVFNGR